MKENILNECVSNGQMVPCSQISGTLFVTDAVGTLVTIAFILAIIVLFFIWAWALYDLIHKRKNFPVAHFVLWLIIVLIGNVLGSILYFVFNRGVLKKQNVVADVGVNKQTNEGLSKKTSPEDLMEDAEQDDFFPLVTLN